MIRFLYPPSPCPPAFKEQWARLAKEIAKAPKLKEAKESKA